MDTQAIESILFGGQAYNFYREPETTKFALSETEPTSSRKSGEVYSTNPCSMPLMSDCRRMDTEPRISLSEVATLGPALASGRS